MSRLIYKKKEFEILKTKRDYIVRNICGDYKNHSHFKSLEGAKICINCVLNKKYPKSIYLLIASKRIARDDKYINNIDHLIKVKKNRKQRYYNAS